MNTSSHLLLQISRWVSSCWQGSFLGLICISLLLWSPTASSPSSCIGRILSSPCSAKACICCAACCHSRIFIHMAVIMMRSKHAPRSTHARLGYNSMPKDILSCLTDFTMRYRGVLRVLAFLDLLNLKLSCLLLPTNHRPCLTRRSVIVAIESWNFSFQHHWPCFTRLCFPKPTIVISQL